MKEKKPLDPLVKKKFQIIARIFAVLMALYLIFSVVISVKAGVSEFFEWGLFLLGIMSLYGLAVLGLLLSFSNFARQRLTAKYKSITIPDGKLDKALSVLSAIFGTLTLCFFILIFPISAADIKAPWNEVTVNSQVSAFMGASFWICLAALAINGFSQLSLKLINKKCEEKEKERAVKTIRILASALLILTFLGSLFIPISKIPYNDSGGVHGRGSVGYRAVMYEWIVWDRTHTFGGEPLPEETQQPRIYFFPFNCYTYDAKWEMKH